MPDRGTAFDPGNEAQRNERLHHFSHALKNRLGSLWQAATLLHELPEGPERRQLLELAERSYFAGAGELEHLMDDFAVPRGIASLQREAVDLAGLIESCIANIAFRTERKDQAVECNFRAALAVIGDRSVLQQLIEALLSNASKFTPKGGKIHVDLCQDNGMACIRVTDNGTGLSPEDLQQAFRRYAILSSRSTDGESQARSTLARARSWAEAHGGTLDAASAGKGQGCTFQLCLPL